MVYVNDEALSHSGRVGMKWYQNIYTQDTISRQVQSSARAKGASSASLLQKVKATQKAPKLSGLSSSSSSTSSSKKKSTSKKKTSSKKKSTKTSSTKEKKERIYATRHVQSTTHQASTKKTREKNPDGRGGRTQARKQLSTNVSSYLNSNSPQTTQKQINTINNLLKSRKR